MEFIAARDFRLNPGKIWRRLKEIHKLIITSNGKPIALLSDIAGRDIEENLKAEAMAEAALALNKLREQAHAKGLDKLTDAEIQAEINSARKTF